VNLNRSLGRVASAYGCAELQLNDGPTVSFGHTIRVPTSIHFLLLTGKKLSAMSHDGKL